MHVLQWRCFRTATHFYFPPVLETIARPLAKAQAPIVRFTDEAGCWNAVTVSSRLNWQKGQY